MEKNNYLDQLYAVIAKMTNPEDVKALLTDMCTIKEVEQMAQRVESARLLLEGNTYEKVITKTKISSATLSRVSNFIQHGSGGYKKAMEILSNKED